MKVVFAPDYRDGNPYQSHLAAGLESVDVTVEFFSHMRRGLPLVRGLRDLQSDILHLHWPEKYFQSKQDGLDLFRLLRFPIDLKIATKRMPLVVTAHNLFPHNRGNNPQVRRNIGITLRHANAIIAHSSKAADLLIRTFGIPNGRIHVIPHGDLAVDLPKPLPRAEAREHLKLGNRPTCLVFGAVNPYKGIVELLDFWKQHSPPVDLVIAGSASDDAFGAKLQQLVDSLDNVQFINHFLNDQDLADWLTAADCTLFNYQTCFTSGAACLARSYGIPILLPNRLDTIDLGEPNGRVFRFDELDETLLPILDLAIDSPSDFPAVAEWRERTSWINVASATRDVYQQVLS